MKTALYALATAILILSACTYTVMADRTAQPESCKGIIDKVELARRGCCSWHGGVCGCSGGSAMCCDGTPSPTCGCKSETPTPEGLLVKPLPFDNAQ